MSSRYHWNHCSERNKDLPGNCATASYPSTKAKVDGILVYGCNLYRHRALKVPPGFVAVKVGGGKAECGRLGFLRPGMNCDGDIYISM